MTDREKYRRTFSHLRAPEGTLGEVLHRTEQRTGLAGRMRRPAAALAAVLALTLGITAAAAFGLYSLRWQQAGEEERYPVSLWTGEDRESALVLHFEGPETARAIRFRPGYLPAPATYVQPVDNDGWYTRLSTEYRNPGGTEQPCLIQVYYAPQFADGDLFLLNGTAGEVREEAWGELQVLEFETEYVFDGAEGQASRQVDGSYVLLFHPAEGYLIVISGQSPLSELERVARELEVEPTGERVTAADSFGGGMFFDWGLG